MASTTFLGGNIRVYPEEISISIDTLRKEDLLHQSR